MYKVLISDSIETTKANLLAALQDRCQLTCINSEAELQAEIQANQFDLIFLDADWLEGQSMVQLDQIHTKDPYLPIIMTSKTEKADTIVQAMNSGASDFLVQPSADSH